MTTAEPRPDKQCIGIGEELYGLRKKLPWQQLPVEPVNSAAQP